jgi:transcription elongation GreA/GreB family factor
MPYDPMTVTIAADDAEALGWLLFESNTHARLKTAAGERLTEKLFAAQILAAEAVPGDVARLGSTVTYTELPAGARRSVRVVTPLHADANEGRVSVLSPIGCALLGHGVGAVVEVQLPTGNSMRVRVEEVEPAAAVSAD